MRFALIAAILATASAQTATHAVQMRDAEIRAVLPPEGKAPTDAQKDRAQKLLTQLIDFSGMVRASLGKNWEKTSKSERGALLDAFTKRFKQVMVGEIDFYRSTKIEYAPEKKQGDLVLVPTSMVVQGEPTHVTYAMKRAKNGWAIEDIIIDDVSTVRNYRSTFRKVIHQEGVKGLISRLNASTAQPAGKE